jgi:hypothetical protein
MKTAEFNSIKPALGGISRRDFLKFCSTWPSGWGSRLVQGAKIAEAITDPKRPPVIWLSRMHRQRRITPPLHPSHPRASSSRSRFPRLLRDPKRCGGASGGSGQEQVYSRQRRELHTGGRRGNYPPGTTGSIARLPERRPCKF